MEVSKPYKIGNYWTNLVDSTTGESVNFEEVAEWYDGTPMDDTKADGVIYRKLPSSEGSAYVKRVYSGPIDSDWLQLDNTGSSDVSGIINSYVQIDNVLLKQGTYRGIFTVSGNKLIGDKSVTLTPNPGVDTTVVTLSLGGGIENISIDGEDTAARGITISETSSGNFDIKNVSIKNLWGENIQSNGIRIVGGAEKIINISGCVFENIDAEQDSSEGNSAGASRAIFVNGDNLSLRITNSIFNGVGSYEDGDAIAINTVQDEDLGWSPINGLVDQCTFYDVRKRAVKVQGSGVTVSNCNIYSDYVDEDECPAAGIMFQGSYNVARNNYIKFSRANWGIHISTGGECNIVDGNYVYLDPDHLYSNARGSNITAAVRDTGNRTRIVNNTFLSANIHGISVQDSVGSLISNNNVEGRIEIRNNTSGAVIESNICTRRAGISGSTRGIVLLGASTVVDIVVQKNTIRNHTFGIGLGTNSVNTAADQWRIKENIGIDLVTRLYEDYLAPEAYSGGYIGGAVDDTGIPQSVIYSSASGKDANDLLPDEVAMMQNTLPNVPPVDITSAGGRWWRILTRRVWHLSGSSTVCLIQEAEAVNGTITNNASHTKCYRTYDGSSWTPWVRNINTADIYIAKEVTTQVNLGRYAVIYHYIDDDSTIPVSTLSNGSVTNLRVYNTDSSDHTITFTGVGSGVTTFTVPAEGFIDLEFIRNNGSTRIFQKAVLKSEDSAAAPSATYDQAEVQAILDELRDLKTKMRAAGLLAT